MRKDKKSLRAATWAAVLLAQVSLCSIGQAAEVSNQKIAFDIPSQDLQSALNEFALQSKKDVLFSPNVAITKRSGKLVGNFDARTALEILLSGTGLEFRSADENTILIGIGSTATTASQAEAMSEELLRVAQNSEKDASNAPSESAGTAESLAASKDARLEEIVVTAQKRAERLQDVPVPVTAISAGKLVDSNQLRLQDYFTRIPGLSVTPATGQYQGSPVLAIRGITTGASNPTVAIVVDDVPYGSSTTLGGGIVAPDLDPSDLAQVEVLRGPQGTLYGVSSLGGLLKYVTVDPSTDKLYGRVQGGLSSVYNGDEMGYTVRGAVNVPLSDTWAVRASGFTRRDPGYIDNIQAGQEGVNQTNADGGRLSASWRPSDVFSLKLGALLQHMTGEGSQEVDVLPGFGDLEQSRLGGTGGYDRRIQSYSATAAVKLGQAELTSVSGYAINKFSDSFDVTALLGPASEFLFGFPGTPLLDHNKTKKFTQEFRLSIPLGQRVDWMLGAFYTDEDTDFGQDIVVWNDSRQVVASWLHSAFPTTFQEYAAFTNLTFRITDKFDIQLGGRQSRNEQTYQSNSVGLPPFVSGAGEDVIPKVSSKDDAFTYLVTPRLRISDDLMVYARLASGYRAGGPNSNCLALALPCEYDPDTTQNYEIGAKGDVLNRRLSFDASIYYIDWKDIQLQLNDLVSGQSYFTNAGRARSQGMELSLESRPVDGLVMTAWVSWNDSELSEDFPAGSTVSGTSGDRLPTSSRWSGNLSVDQHFPLTSTVTGFIGGSMSYVGDRKGGFVSVFAPSPARQTYPAYTQTDLRAGLSYESWTANLFVNNVTDKRGLLAGGIGNLFPYTFSYIQPRIVGLSLTKSFK
jgi:outer membrane receptor protein involved in Fe transport